MQKFILFENYSLEGVLKVFFANSFMRKNPIEEESIDIGLNDNEFILGLEIIRKINDKKIQYHIKILIFFQIYIMKMIIFIFINQIFHNFKMI